MPLINVNNTTDPKNNVIPATDFQNIPVNLPSPLSAVQEVNVNEIKQYSAPLENNEVTSTKDIKEDFDSKINNVIPVLDVKEELPPLASPEELTNIQSVLAETGNSNKSLESILETSVSPVISPVQDLTTPVEQVESTPLLQPEIIPPVEQIPVQPQLTPKVDVETITPTIEQEVVQQTVNGILQLDEILQIAIKRKASDIHLTPGYRTIIRVDGKLEVASSAVLNPSIVNQYVMDLLKNRPEVQINSIKEFDLTYTSGDRRFRVNIFRQMGNFSITLRVIPERIFSIGELGLPDIISEFPSFPNGLVLVTGPTGSGKSTTIAAILNQINLTLPKHIVTLEDPIEFVFPKGVGLVDQRESGIDFTSWDNALRSVLRQDPDVVLVGEMRDLETVEAALQIAETGHLVFATLHTNGAAETINRVIDIFDSQKQDQIRVQLSSVLRAVVSQKLVAVSTGGRKAAVEILLSTPGIRNAIRDKKTFQIGNIIQTSTDIGMVSMEKSLVKMVKDGLISKEMAKSLSVNPNEIDILLQ